jgi:XRE family transcriptional regulator, thiamine biosynthesis regulator
LQPPDELMVQEFLPAVRMLVARELEAQGFAQSKIAYMLGVTQPSVSLYLRAEKKRAYSTLETFRVSREDADSYVALLAEDVKRSPVDAVSTLSAFWTGLLGSGSVCSRHREQYTQLVDCDVCMKEYARERPGKSEIIEEVSDAVRSLESSETFVKVMPEVSVNLACAAASAASPADVVAIPGRIVRVGGRAKALLPPEYGASRHLSRVLLLARKVMPDVRACINLRYDPKVGRILKRLRLRTAQIGDYVSPAGDPTVEALKKLSQGRTPFDALVDTGGNGVEPNLYLFATGAREAAILALRISDSLSAA